jgi:hypothetical protein
MLERLESVPWSSLAQPSANKPSSVPDALARLAAAESETEAREAYHRFLFTVGNDHAGTYFPVVIQTLPFIEEVLRGPAVHARNAALEILIDLTGSFAPDPSHELVDDETRGRLPLRQLVLEHMTTLSDLIRTLALDISADYTTRRLASDLLDLLHGR